jgi:hypothetical protein
MFSGARYLCTVGILTLSLGPVVTHAQSGTQGHGGQGGVTWLLPGMPVHPDSFLAICAPPQPRKVVQAKKSVTKKPSAPKLTLTPTNKPKPSRPKPKKIAIPDQPRLVCPQIQLEPTMMGTLDLGESIIPMPGEFPKELEQMALVAPRQLPIDNITPVTVSEGKRRLGPLIWLFGGGAGITVFSHFTGGDNPGGTTPRNPLDPPTPPGLQNPEVPPSDPKDPPPNPELPPPVTTTPEPGTLLLMGTGLAGVAGAWRRRQRREERD